MLLLCNCKMETTNDCVAFSQDNCLIQMCSLSNKCCIIKGTREFKIVRYNSKTAPTETAFKHGLTVTHLLISLNKHTCSGCESKKKWACRKPANRICRFIEAWIQIIRINVYKIVLQHFKKSAEKLLTYR